ncbi:hypothetical protein ACOMHN_046279 [Nucella lapillus]
MEVRQAPVLYEPRQPSSVNTLPLWISPWSLEDSPPDICQGPENSQLLNGCPLGYSINGRALLPFELLGQADDTFSQDCTHRTMVRPTAPSARTAPGSGRRHLRLGLHSPHQGQSHVSKV